MLGNYKFSYITFIINSLIKDKYDPKMYKFHKMNLLLEFSVFYISKIKFKIN